MLNASERQRYERQLIMPEISESGQTKIRNASIFIAGIGGLGSISAFYMTAMGAGRIRLVDRDRVQLSNLNRQIMHHTSDVGKWKTRSAGEKLTHLNPDSQLEPIRESITQDNVLDLVRGCDLILDATDNQITRKVLNSAAIALQIPFIYGGINGFTGMVSTFRPKATACFECIFPDAPNQPAGPIGVLGPVPGLVASLQCIEAVKVILDLDPSLMNRLLRINGWNMSFKTTHLTRNEDCNVCSNGRNNHVTEN
jgi:molybdopterin/thiamine biosynthesis adenylyltransferase